MCVEVFVRAVGALFTVGLVLLFAFLLYAAWREPCGPGRGW